MCKRRVGSQIAGKGGAEAGGVVSQSSGSASNSVSMSSSFASLVSLVSPKNSSIVSSKNSLEELAILLFAIL